MNFDNPAVFGEIIPDVEYIKRPGSYGLILDELGRVGMLSSCLPGGGAEPGESEEQTLHREVREECGWTIEIIERLGFAFEYVFAEGEGYFRKGCTFYRAKRIGSMSFDPPDLLWLEPGPAARQLKFGSQRWAVSLLGPE